MNNLWERVTGLRKYVRRFKRAADDLFGFDNVVGHPDYGLVLSRHRSIGSHPPAICTRKEVLFCEISAMPKVILDAEDAVEVFPHIPPWSWYDITEEVGDVPVAFEDDAWKICWEYVEGEE